MEAAFDFFAKWQYKLSADEPTQRTFADQWGFLSAAHLAACRSRIAAGISLGYPKLLERVSAALSGLRGGPSETAGAVAALIRSNRKLPGLPSVAVRGAGVYHAGFHVSC